MQKKTGRPQAEYLRKPRSFKASDEEWKTIQDNANLNNMNTSEFIRYRAINNPNKSIEQANEAIEEFKKAVKKIP